jgi:WD40 repeat protein
MGIFGKLFGRRSAGSEPHDATPAACDEARGILGGHQAEITAVGFVLGGKLLLSGDARGKLMAWKVPSFERHLEMDHNRPLPVYSFVGGARGDVYYGYGAAVKQWKTGAGFLDDFSELQSFTFGEAHTKEVVPILFTARELISGGYDGKLCFWDPNTGEAQAGSLKSPILSLAVAGTRLAAGLEDGSVAIFDLERHEALGGFGAHARDVYAVSFQNGAPGPPTLLATTSPSDRTVRIWRNEELVAELEASGFTAAFSPDGRFLAHGEGTDIVIRGAKDWKLVRRLRGHQAPVSVLAFSASGGWLASGAYDRTVRVWSLADATATPRSAAE